MRETLRIIQDGWGFACEWYKPEQTERGIQNQRNDPPLMAMPEDVYSHDFAVWLTDQYRLAMRKGIELGVESVRAEEVQHQSARIAELERENAELRAQLERKANDD